MTELEQATKRNVARLELQVRALAESVATLQQELLAKKEFNNFHLNEWTDWTDGQNSKTVAEIAGEIMYLRALADVAAMKGE